MGEIVATDDVLDGAPRIAGRRIGVHHVARRVIDVGEQPAAVAGAFELELADVHRALAYYYEHPDEMRAIRVRGSNPPEGHPAIRGPDDLDDAQEPEPEA